MFFPRHFAIVVACALATAAPAVAGPPVRRQPNPTRATLERSVQPRPAPALPAQHRPEAERSPQPEPWNPLKRKRMALPAAPAPPGDYAF